MIFILLTLLAALALAGVSGWFSIVGVMAIYAGAPIHALIMGVVLELGKLVSTSWIYRNWNYSGWTLKGPLIAFTVALMLITSIGVFGFLSKSHLEQGAKTIDNAPRVERLEQQITREKSVIADNEKVINQLDATINSYLGKDRADRSVVIRRNQAPQRKQLREDIDAANKRIDTFNEEKFKLQSEIRNLELEVGPIRYIAELMYGSENNSTKNIEGAVKIFTLLIVSTLDPLAIILLVAANHSIMRRSKEKVPNEKEEDSEKVTENNNLPERHKELATPEGRSTTTLETLEKTPEEVTTLSSTRQKIQDTVLNEKEEETPRGFVLSEDGYQGPNTRSSVPTGNLHEVSEEKVQEISSVKWEDLNPVVRELIGTAHFIPQKVNEEEKIQETPSATNTEVPLPENIEKIRGQRSDIQKTENETQNKDLSVFWDTVPKYPIALSWLREFKR